VLYNSANSFISAISLISPDSPVGQPVPGENEVFLSSGNGPSSTIAQTGQFPAWASTIQFLSGASLPNINFWEVTVNGTNIPVHETSQVGQFLFLYEGDISAFAGQTGELGFSTLNVNSTAGAVKLADIQFGPVPEPSSVSLLLIGSLISWWKCRAGRSERAKPNTKGSGN
jgi:hypothetical protein